MKSSEWLDRLLELFQGSVDGAEFRRAYPGAWGSRALRKPLAVGEVEGETVRPGADEVKLRFTIFLPDGTDGKRAEEIFSAMCAQAGKAYPGFSAISRGAAGRDKTTGLLSVPCFLTFLFQTGGGEGARGKKAVLGGREYWVTGVKTSMSRNADELVSIGETEPFALRERETEYTVELEGLDVSGLERLAGFTAEIGAGPDSVYRNCRWKSLSDVLRKAVFVSSVREQV